MSKEKLEFAKSLIKSESIKDIDDLFKIITKKYIAELLGLKPISFSSKKLKHPGEFRLSELIALANLFDVDLYSIVNIFKESIK